MKKIAYILIATITFLVIPNNTYVHSKKPDYKLLYDTLITTLEPSIEKEIINYYGYHKQYGLYDAKILRIIREHEGGFSFIAKVQVKTFEHAHDPPYGKETMTFNISPFGVKTISFKHVGDKVEKEIYEFYKATLSDIKQSFNLNLEAYSSYTYNQLQYKAEINSEFKSLFNIAEEIVTNILLPERKIPYKNVIDPVTFLKGDTGYMLFKKSDGTNVIYQVQKQDGNWIVTDKNSKQGKKMNYKLLWYAWDL
ncbi:DUF3888 domain-containing protein [Lederbergia wuyishanensis]|uniref:DUF3888 domain-containing protein n=1 Tax=Lederbergia wuyishanensis TaxID=1347903 RepID=A0ABU0D2S6_9BACI|nr:DUF3888 domain-containing protein [Lederbergia wuyishanensis]MCJ8007156.1 DUF3888 domain-containing protein [Lederbergia wuyishanensis]MDQ0342699.1 hypothetical protein [Lederbergia wuyishanensis]